MEHTDVAYKFWQDLTILLAATAFVTAAFRKIGWNPILGLVAAGAAIGPQGFHLIGPESGVNFLGDVGVMFLLFAVGMELSPDRIRAMARWIFGLGSAHFVLCAAALAWFANLLGARWEAAAAIGIALSLSSTAFVLQLLAERGEIGHRFGRRTFAVLLFQDLMVAPILAFLPLLAGRLAPVGDTPPMPILPAVICMFVLFMVVRMVLETVLGVIHETARADAFPAAILFTALAMGWAAKALGLSPTLGAFLAGFAISGAHWRHEVKSAIGPFENTLLGFFFIGIGLRVPMGPVEDLIWMALAAFGLVGVKATIGLLACLLNGSNWRESVRASLALAQAGEFGFVVLGTAAANRMLPLADAVFWSSAAVFSMALTPALIGIGGLFDDDAAAKAGDATGPSGLPEGLSEAESHQTRDDLAQPESTFSDP